MYNDYVAVSSGTIYCTGSTPYDGQDVYSYIYYKNWTDQWKQLPRPGHHLGVLHMVDDKLNIFGGADPTTDEYIN